MVLGEPEKVIRVLRSLAPWLAPALFALGWVVAMPPYDLPEAAYVFLIPLILWVFMSPQPKLVFRQVWIASTVAWFFILSWLPAFTDHLAFPMAGLLGWLAALALAAVLALFPACWAWFAARSIPQVLERGAARRILLFTALAALWVLLEWLRSWVLTGFPWLPLAASQWQRPLLLQILSWTGAWGLSFVLVFFNLGLAAYLRSLRHWRGKRWWQRLSPEFYSAFGLLGATVFFGLSYSGNFAARQSLLTVAFVQPYIAAPEKWDPQYANEALETLEHVTELGALLQPDLLLWPEATLPFPLKGNWPLEDWVAALSKRLEKPMLMGAVVVERSEQGEDWFNGVFWVDPEKGVDTDNYYAKRHLVPFGEYVPFGRWLPFLDKVIPLDGSFRQGTEPTLLRYQTLERTLRIGPLVCYEDIFPSLARSSVNAGADLLFVATNNAWFGEGSGAWQHAAHSVLRAVETRRPVLRTGNGGWSGWIDDHGHIRHITLDRSGSIYFQGVDTAEITRSRHWIRELSFYVRFGDWFVLFSAFLCWPLIRTFLRDQEKVT